MQVQVAAYSPWMQRADEPADGQPANVSFTRLPQHELRDLYARSMFVVVPLMQSYYQSGSLVIYEAMAMGKAVITAETQGQKALGLIQDGETGIYYKPGNVLSLRAAIQRLLDNPDEARQMGDAARARVEQELNLDHYVTEITELVQKLDPAPST